MPLATQTLPSIEEAKEVMTMAQIYPAGAPECRVSRTDRRIKLLRHLSNANSSRSWQNSVATAAVRLHTWPDGRVGLERAFAMPGAAAVDSGQTKFGLSQLPSQTGATHGAYDARCPIDRP